jgi:hypothetical protein
MFKNFILIMYMDFKFGKIDQILLNIFSIVKYLFLPRTVTVAVIHLSITFFLYSKY